MSSFVYQTTTSSVFTWNDFSKIMGCVELSKISVLPPRFPKGGEIYVFKNAATAGKVTFTTFKLFLYFGFKPFSKKHFYTVNVYVFINVI